MTADDWQQAWRDLILAKGLKVLNWDDSATNLLSRLRLGECQPERWPDVSDEALLTALDDWLMPFLTNARHQRDLKKLNLSDALLSQLEWDQQQGLASLVPTHITVPSGSNIRIDYRQNPPVLAVKLQEMFGFEGQPAILNGQLPLMIHLLSPAQRRYRSPRICRTSGVILTPMCAKTCAAVQSIHGQKTLCPLRQPDLQNGDLSKGDR